MGFLGQIEPKLQKLDLKIVFIDGKNYPDLEDIKFDLFPPIFTILPVFLEPENYQKIKDFSRNLRFLGSVYFFPSIKTLFKSSF